MASFRRGHTGRVLAGGVALAVMTYAAAQAAQPAQQPAGGAGSSGPTTTQLGEIVVTAQKRSENLEKTPIAITALTSQRIEQANLDRPEKLQFTVPSMTNNETSGFSFLTLRGVGSNTAGLSDSVVATYQDGVYSGMQITERVPTFDLQRIEVLRGPQGTLYGRNTTGGVINYITKDPSFEFGGVGEVSYGNYNSVETNLGLTGPIVQDKIAARASIHYSSHDGYYPNVTTGGRDYAGRDLGARLSVLFRPTDHLSVIVRGDMEHNTSSATFVRLGSASLDGLTDETHPLGIFSQPASFFASHPGLLSPADIAKLNGGSIASHYGLIQPGVAAPDPLTAGKTANWLPGLYKTEARGTSVTATWDAGPATVKSITAYRYGSLYSLSDPGGLSWPVVTPRPLTLTEKQYTQEFNVSGKAFDNRLDWLFGTFYYHDDGKYPAQYYLASLGQILQANVNLANPPGSPYAFNLNPATLTPLSNLPGVFPSPFNTALATGPGFPGDAAGSLVRAGSTIPSTAFESTLETQQSNSYAAFFQATYHVTDALRLTGGFRYTVDQKDAHRVIHNNFVWDLTANGLFEAVQAGVLPPAAYNPATIAAAAGVCDTHTSKTWRAPTGMVDVEYDAAPHVMTYAKASWGYKSGGMNNSECTNIYNPEYLTDYEGGVKAVLADGQVLANLAMYYYDYSNIQFLTFSSTTTLIKNAGSAKAYGVELEYALRPRFAPGWQVDGSASFEDSHYGQGCFGDPANTNNAGFLSSPLQSCPATVINPSTGLPVPIGATADIKGNEMIRAPRWKTNFGVQYSTDVGDFGSLLARVDAAWTDKYYNDIWNGKVHGMEASTQPSYWVLSALLSWTTPDKRYSAEVFGENLTKTLYSVDAETENLPPTMYIVSGQLGSPRTFGVRLRGKFGPGSYSYCVINDRRCACMGRAQHGHRRRVWPRARVKRRLMVAMELGTWRSGRIGGSAGSITCGKARRLACRGARRS